MSEIVFSCIIPASTKDAGSQMLKDLIASIRAQDFPQDQIEILVITEGDSEQAKGIGIKRAKGEICAMFCADNKIMHHDLFRIVKNCFNPEFGLNADSVYTIRYYYKKDDNSLNRYFSLIGGNDPICYYVGKNDRQPYVKSLIKTSSYTASFGCNGFFVKRENFNFANLDHYYPMDAHVEMMMSGKNRYVGLGQDSIWHRTSYNLISFLKKRYRYARDLYCDRKDRRWRIIDGAQDVWKLAGFIICVLTVVPCLYTSIRGFLKVHDWAWFWHWPVCFGFLITYTILVIRNLFKHGQLFQIKCAQEV